MGRNGGAPTFWFGQNAAQLIGGGIALTYPGDHQVTGSYTAGPPGIITIDVPVADMQVAGALDNRLHQVTASTQGLTEPAETVPSLGGTGGDYFDLFDVADSYDFVPPFIKVSGHAHSDYNSSGTGGVGDVHVETQNITDHTGDATPPTGVFRYRDLRADPGGAADGPFECLNGVPTFLAELGPKAVRITGNISCTGGMTGVTNFIADVVDNGPNPPNTDDYHVVLKNSEGETLYDWDDNTSVGVGDLTVVIRAT
ncbi:MAG TPA: hypothetical protein DIT48_06085 [Actinobacteria bacterium]|jgi:hypothetical protein|nr:hypothetical protein [Actinomycetota bacterium]HCP62003.1 hypothetical protein [Actinomycetota bacterium]